MQLIWIILRWLYPHDPVRVSTLALREHVVHLAATICNAAQIALLDRDDAYRAHVESILIDYEAGLQRVIAQRACQIAGILFDPRHTRIFIPRHPRPTAELLARLGDLARALDRIEHLAQIRAARLIRERDADPLGLTAHGSPDALNSAWLRDAAHHEALSKGKRPTALILRDREAIVSKDEGGLTARATSARAPPIFDVHPHPKPASQAHLRGRGPMPCACLNRLPSPPALTLRLQQQTCERTFTLRGLSA